MSCRPPFGGAARRHRARGRRRPAAPPGRPRARSIDASGRPVRAAHRGQVLPGAPSVAHHVAGYRPPRARYPHRGSARRARRRREGRPPGPALQDAGHQVQSAPCAPARPGQSVQQAAARPATPASLLPNRAPPAPNCPMLPPGGASQTLSGAARSQGRRVPAGGPGTNSSRRSWSPSTEETSGVERLPPPPGLEPFGPLLEGGWCGSPGFSARQGPFGATRRRCPAAPGSAERFDASTSTPRAGGRPAARGGSVAPGPVHRFVRVGVTKKPGDTPLPCTGSQLASSPSAGHAGTCTWKQSGSIRGQSG